MEGGSAQNSGHPSSFDKSRVWDVKPLRYLVPVFSSPPQAPPFVCSPPFGPYPPGFTPFYPFNVPQGSQNLHEVPNPSQANPTPMPAPLRSFRTPFPGDSNGDICGASAVDEDGGYVSSRKKGLSSGLGSSQKRPKKSRDVEFSVSGDYGNWMTESYAGSFSLAQQDDGNRELVCSTLLKFDALRRRLCQLEDSKQINSGATKRADLKAVNILMNKGVRTNKKKRIGIVPGVEIGDIFFFRFEMCLVGLHSQSMAGIDYLTLKGYTEEEPAAVSIVSSGGYDDDVEDSDFLIYSGQGGNVNRKDKEVADQKLERGNLALDRSMRRANEVRVIRGIKDHMNPLTKVYVYDGLYKIQESWVEKGKSGHNIFKYKLVRLPGQPSAFALWKSIQKWRDGLSSRVGLVLPDLTSGAEAIPVSLVNDVDGEKGPDHFDYISTLKYSKSFNLSQPSSNCHCRNACNPGVTKCACIMRNGGNLPYTSTGVLVGRIPLLHECSHTCLCFSSCKNKVSQTGLKIHLEVFKTKDRGWGLRSWDPIRAGTFICEYAGEVIDGARATQEGDGEKNEYIFDTSRKYNSFKWNNDPALFKEASTDDSEEFKLPSPLIINAKDVGNVARFMNHSCSPNVLWQPVVYEQNNQSFIHIAFFAIQHIPPLTELTYDYGISELEGRRRKCLCGSSKCKGYFG
ncbi:Pre-SET domain [Dillenia turbinata]|uniref:Pre-SET domain n=1 Tax=Dillenia turbinata TaxID=194707 RepID=A0AAN8ZHE7_9MAGN